MPWLSPALLLTLAVAPPPDDPPNILAAIEDAIATAIEQVQPSVVAITRIRSENGQTLAIRGRTPIEAAPPRDQLVIEFAPGFPGNLPVRPGFPNEAAPEYVALPGDYGSGVVVGAQGEILTTYHLLRGAKQIRVRSQGAEFDAEIIAADPRTDLAVIVPRGGSNVPARFAPIPIGDSTKLRQGSFLIALGNPYNAARDGKATASLGILANTSRRIEPPQGENPNIKHIFRFQPTLLQLDSKLNLGMSGGAVVNLKGELIGITTSEASPSGFDIAAGYAIPMDPIGRRAVQALMEGKEVQYGFIGIGLSSQPNVIREVREGTPAWKAKLASGDRILAVGETQLNDDESALPLALASVPVGQPVKLQVLHNGQPVERTLVMSKYPVGDAIATNRPTPWRGARIDFSSVLADGLSTDATLESMTRGGIGVIEVVSGSLAESAGLARGLVITAVAGRPVNTPGEFEAAVAEFEGKPVTLTTVGGLEDAKTVVIPAR